jgi:hypothetical protein
MRPLFQPAKLGVLPFGSLHVDSATSDTVITPRGYRWKISGINTGGVLPAYTVLQRNNIAEYGSRFVAGSELVLDFPCPLQLQGIKFKVGAYTSGGGSLGSISNDNEVFSGIGGSGVNQLIKIQGLDKTMSANGIWRDLCGTYNANLGEYDITQVAVFTESFYAEALRMKLADGSTGTYSGFSLVQIRSLY